MRMNTAWQLLLHRVMLLSAVMSTSLLVQAGRWHVKGELLYDEMVKNMSRAPGITDMSTSQGTDLCLHTYADGT